MSLDTCRWRTLSRRRTSSAPEPGYDDNPESGREGVTLVEAIPDAPDCMRGLEGDPFSNRLEPRGQFAEDHHGDSEVWWSGTESVIGRLGA